MPIVSEDMPTDLLPKPLQLNLNTLKPIVMEELDKFLEYCKSAYDQRPCATDKSKCIGEKKCENKNCTNCEGCLQDIHNRSNSQSDYGCEYQTYFYVMKFFYRYASEIGIVLHENLQDILSQVPINVVSIGCGPSSELYGFLAFLIANNKVVDFNYWGFDFNSIWTTVQHKNQDIFSRFSIRYSDMNGFDFIRNHKEIDLLILNYVLSDLTRRNDSTAIAGFISCLEEIIRDKTVRYVLINDIYLTYNTRTAYAIMRDFVRFCFSNGIRKEDVFRYQFKEPNQFQTKFGSTPRMREVIFKRNIALTDIDPWLDLGSMGVIIKVK